MQGKYEPNWPEIEIVREGKSNDSSEDESLPQPIRITYGYSRDYRPDLKQFMLDLIVSGDGDIPLFLSFLYARQNVICIDYVGDPEGAIAPNRQFLSINT